MGRYYLDKLENYQPVNTYTNTPEGVPDSREAAWAEERQKYGFDSRDTWSLDTTMTELIYERLNLYLERADEVIIISDERRRTIERMISLAKIVLLEEVDELDAQKASTELWTLWAENHLRMWW